MENVFLLPAAAQNWGDDGPKGKKHRGFVPLHIFFPKENLLNFAY